MTQIIETPLRRIPLDTGDVLHGLKVSESSYSGFGEVYFSSIHPGVFKGWKRHNLMTMNLIVVSGLVRFIFYDNTNLRSDYIIGDSNYSRLTIPPGFWFGFQGIASSTSILCNLSNIEHDPNEVERLPPSQFSYS